MEPPAGRRLASSTTSDYDLSLSPAVDTAPGTVEGFDYDAIGRVTSGDTLVAEASGPNLDGYLVEIYDETEDVQGSGVPDSDGIVAFDTADLPPAGVELEPGTFAVVVGEDTDNPEAAHPLVVRAYEMALDSRPIIDSGEEFTVTTTLDPLPVASEYTIKDVKLRYWTADSKTTTSMSKDGDLTYSKTLSDPPAETFSCQATVLIDSDSDNVDSESIGVTDRHIVTVVEGSDTLAVAGESAAAGPGPQFTRPAVGTEDLFVGGLGPAVRAFPKDTIRDGTTPTWTVQRVGALSDASPVLDGGTIYVGSGGGRLYALDTAGNTVWEFDTGDAGTASAITATPAVDADRSLVYVATNDGTLYAVSTGTDGGTAQWSVDVGGPAHSAVALGSGRAFLTTVGGALVAVDPDTQTVESTALAGEFAHRRPVVEGGTVYVAAAGVHAFDATASLETATPDWSQTSGFVGSARSAPALVDGQVFVGDGESITALAADTGTRAWRYETNDPVVATPLGIDGRALVATTAGELLLFGSSGTVRAGAYPGVPIWSRPVVDGGTVFLQSSRGSATADPAILALDVNRL